MDFDIDIIKTHVKHYTTGFLLQVRHGSILRISQWKKMYLQDKKNPYTCIGIMYMYMHIAQYTCICMYLTVIQTKNSYETGFSIKA